MSKSEARGLLRDVQNAAQVENKSNSEQGGDGDTFGSGWIWTHSNYRASKESCVELPYDPAIPLLGIYLEKNLVRKGTCTPVFTAALFTIAKTWKQPKCPSTDEWIKKMGYIYT